jgi:hypothetical protein
MRMLLEDSAFISILSTYLFLPSSLANFSITEISIGLKVIFLRDQILQTKLV